MGATVSFRFDYQVGRAFEQGESLGGLGVVESLKSHGYDLRLELNSG